MDLSNFKFEEGTVLELYFPDPVDKVICDGLIETAKQKQKEIDVMIAQLENLQNRIQDPVLKQKVIDRIKESKRKRI